jgi:5'-3' exonuclease
MSENVHWLSRKKLYTQELFEEEYKFKPNEQTVTLFKSLLGDDSDNIPSIKGINEQTALNIVHNFIDVFDLINCVKLKNEKSNILSDFAKKTVIENKDRLILNHQLIYFNDITQEEIQQSVVKGLFDKKALTILYNTLGFDRNFDDRLELKKINFDSTFSFDVVKRK